MTTMRGGEHPRGGECGVHTGTCMECMQGGRVSSRVRHYGCGPWVR